MNFETDFWPWYLRAHQRRATKICHAVATLSCLGLMAAGVVTLRPVLVLLGPLVDYAIAQSSHRLIEHNATRPWKHPWFHLRAELRLLWGTLTGRWPPPLTR